MLKKSLATLLFLLPVVGAACADGSDLDLDDDGDVEVDDETKNEAVATTTNELGRKCYCAGSFACGHSRSTSFMHPNALTAMRAAGVPDSALTQTYGDAAASVGTHCPEPGARFSAATDLAQGANPCDRVHKLRARGFAAWFRTAPEFPGNLHIHAVYAGAPNVKASLQRQISSFLQRRNGLASNGIDNHCPITDADLAGVRAAQRGGAAPAPAPKPSGASPTIPGPCVAGGRYCGGDKLSGDPNTLYVCNKDRATGTVIQACANGCSINSGRDDSCN